MNREDIIRMAQEIWGKSDWNDAQTERLERFADLVAAAEREECAKVCEDKADFCNRGSPLHTILSSNAAAIRARGMNVWLSEWRARAVIAKATRGNT